MELKQIAASLRFEALRNEAKAKLLPESAGEYLRRAKLFRAAADALDGTAERERGIA